MHTLTIFGSSDTAEVWPDAARDEISLPGEMLIASPSHPAQTLWHRCLLLRCAHQGREETAATAGPAGVMVWPGIRAI